VVKHASAPHLELLLGLDANENRGTSLANHDFIWVMYRFADQSKGALELLDDRLDELRKVQMLAVLLVPQILGQHGDDFRVGVALKLVASLLQEQADLLVVGDDAIVNDGKLGREVRAVRMAVDSGRLAVRRPSRVGHGSLAELLQSQVDGASGIVNVLSQGRYFANLLKEDRLIRWLVPINLQAYPLV
jgi:hypothetical protein